MPLAALTLTAAIVAATPLAASSAAATPYGVRVWQTDDGLPRNSVQAIAQTRDGYLWIGTQRGLVRFDGVHFAAGLVDPVFASRVAAQSVRALMVTPDGRLWIGLDGGGLLERGVDGRMHEHDLGDLGRYVRALAVSADGSVLAGTSSGLGRYRDGRWTRVAMRTGTPRGAVYAIREDLGGRIWLATNAGVLLVDGSEARAFTSRDGLADDAVWALERDPSGTVWAGTRAGLSRLADATARRVASGGFAGERVRALHLDRNGRLWVGTDGGLHEARDGRALSASPGTRPIDGTIFCLFEDREANLWVGTNAGLYRVRAGHFGTLTVDGGLPHNVVLPVLEDRRGRVWIGTWGGGLTVRDGPQLRTFTRRDGLADDRVFALLEDRRGAIWAGTETGVARSAGGRFERLPSIDVRATGRALALYEDRRGTVWMGTDRGLFRLESSRAVPVALAPTATGRVRVMVEDDRRRLRVARGRDLFELDEPGRASARVVFRASAPIGAMHLDVRGVLWLALEGGGLVRLDDRRAATIDGRHGLVDDELLAILSDGSDRLWFSTKRGLARAGRHDLDEVAAGRSASVLVSTYGARDGMASTECSGDAAPAAWRRRDGTLWFPTTRGVVVVDPSALATNALPPPVAVEAILHRRQPLDPAAHLELSPGPGDLEVRYTALSFVAPDKIRFRHRLDGRDRDWMDAGPRRAAFYTDLPPGSYRFRVVASNEDGVWSESEASVALTVRPQLYQTRTFLVLCLAAGAVAAWAAYGFRIRQMTIRLAAVKAERNRMAREIHDTLLQGVAGIGYQLEAVRHRLRSQPDAAEQHLDRVAEHVDSCLAEARRSVRNMRSKWLERHDLADALHDAGRQLAGGTAIALRVDVFGTPRPLEGDVESQCLRIGQEAMANAVTHGRPSRVDVALHFERRRLTLAVSDDGCGFARTAAGAADRYGLMGMAERARQLGARLRVDSQPGRGTRVTLDVPTSRWRGRWRGWRFRPRAVAIEPQPGDDLGRRSP